MVILILFLLSTNSKKVFDNNQKIDILTKEVSDLQKRIGVFNKAFLNSEDMESSLKILNSLVPNTEDYFSVIYALDKLSKQTNFVINSYSIGLKSSTPGKLKLTIVGNGDRNAFLKFLSEYNFGGDRLITSDKIELTPQISGQIKIDVTFYSQNASLSKTRTNTTILSESLLQELASLKEKVHLDLKESTIEAEFDFNYPRKTNPF